MSVRAKVFKTNRSQAIRLPKAVAFPDDVEEVVVVVSGNSRIITPAGGSWAEWFRNGPRASVDFNRGEDLPPEEREPL